MKKLYSAALNNRSNEPVDVQPFLDKLSAYTGGNYSGEYGEPDLHSGILLVWDDIIKLTMVVIPPLREIFLGQVASIQEVPGWLNLMSRCFRAQCCDEFNSLEEMFRTSIIDSDKGNVDSLSEFEQISKANGMLLKRVPEILVISVESPYLKLVPQVQGKSPSGIKFPKEFDLSDFCAVNNQSNNSIALPGFMGSRNSLSQSSPSHCYYELTSLIVLEGPSFDNLNTYFRIGNVDSRKWYRSSNTSIIGISESNAIEDNYFSISKEKRVHPRLLVYVRKDLHLVLERTIQLVSKAGQLKALGDVAFALAMTTENYGEARRCYEEAIALDESLRPPLVDNLNILDKIERTQKARVLEEQADLALANKRFKECSEMYSRSMICAVKGSNIYVRVREKLEYASKISSLEVACMFAERGDEELEKCNYTTAKDYFLQTTKIQKEISHLNTILASIDKTMQFQTASQKIAEAQAAMKASKFKLCNQLFREAIVLVPQKLELFQSTLDQLGPLMQAEDALVKHKIALTALEEKNFANATVYFTEAISLLPQTCNSEHAVFLCDRAQAYLDVAQYDQAIEDCTKALDLNPDLAMAHFRLGIAYFEMNSYDEAINSYEKALKNDNSLSEQVKVKLRQVSSAKEVMERKVREAEREQKKIEEEKAREEKRARDEAIRKEKAEKAAKEKAEKAERQRLKDEERKATALKEKEMAEEAKKNKEAEKERQRVEKEERDRQKVLEREQQKLEKERERERQKQEKEAKAALEKKIKEDELKRREEQLAEMDRALKRQKEAQEAKEAEREKARLERERIIAEREKARSEKTDDSKKISKSKGTSPSSTSLQNSPKVTRPSTDNVSIDAAPSPWTSQSKPSAIMEAAPKPTAAPKPDFPVLGEPKPIGSRLPNPPSLANSQKTGDWMLGTGNANSLDMPPLELSSSAPLQPSPVLGGLGGLTGNSYSGFGGLGLGSFLSSPPLTSAPLSSSSDFDINGRMGSLGLNDPISMALDSLGTSPGSSYGLGLGGLGGDGSSLGSSFALGNRTSGSRLNLGLGSNLGGLGTDLNSNFASSLGGLNSQSNINGLNGLSNNSLNGLPLNSNGFSHLGSLSTGLDNNVPTNSGIFSSLNRSNLSNNSIMPVHHQSVQQQMKYVAPGMTNNNSNFSSFSSMQHETYPKSPTDISSRRSLDDNLLPEHAFSSVAWLRQYGICMYRWAGNSSEWTEYALHLPMEIVNSILGPEGSTLNEIQSRSGCKIWLDHDILQGKTTSFLIFQRGASGQPSNACMNNALDLVNLLIRRLLHNNPNLLPKVQTASTMLMRSSSDPLNSSWVGLPSQTGFNGSDMNNNSNNYGFRSHTTDYF